MRWRDELRKRFLERPPDEFSADVECSVLVPLLVDRTAGEETLLLTKRTSGVATHKSQVSFPGGFRETFDATLLAAALRETEEEVGIAPADVELLGALPVVVTRGSVRIAPFVGIIEAPYDLRPSAREVDRVMYLPVERLVREGLAPVLVPIEGLRVQSEGITVDGELVWGATARMLTLLRELLGNPSR